jgi:hypothetical protein
MNAKLLAVEVGSTLSLILYGTSNHYFRIDGSILLRECRHILFQGKVVLTARQEAV